MDAVWYRLDTSDRDLFVFLTYLIAGIKQYYPPFGNEIWAHLTQAQSRRIEDENMVRYCIQEIESVVTTPLVIVLDDYHFVHQVLEIQNTIQLLIEYLPQNIHLVLISRHPVALSLSRLRAFQTILEIGPLDLMIKKQEMEQLFTQTFELPLGLDQIKILHQKTHGWISGLILFYLSLTTKDIRYVQSQLALFNGSKGIITEYMDENIYNTLGEEFKEFLMKTSILSHLNADICNKVLAVKNARKVLEKLSKGHFFTICLDEKKNEYCYHHLFQEFLKVSFFGCEKLSVPRQSAGASVGMQTPY